MYKRNANIERSDIYQTVTDTIVAAIEAGVSDFKMPWVSRSIDAPVNVASKKRYRGVNIIMLWAQAMNKGYSSNVWGTYKQFADLGGQVRKGEKSTHVVYWSTFDKKVQLQDGSEDMQKQLFCKSYAVFNIEQVDGYEMPVVETLSEDERIAHAEGFFANLNATLVHEGSRALYSPSRDEIRMPPFAMFKSVDGYYSTLAHEFTHWTGHEKRCDRDFSKGVRFGDEAYAFEELVAELGAAFVCSELQIVQEVREDHAKYIASWLKVLKQDKKAIFTAAAQAQKAVDYMLKLQPNEEAEEEEMEMAA